MDIKLKEYWLMPANSKYYDHKAAFEKCGYIDWKQTRRFNVGDVVYLYCTSPISKVRYKTVVEEIDLTPHEDEYWKTDYSQKLGNKSMRLRLVKTIDDNRVSLNELKKKGMSYIPQGPSRVKEPLKGYLNELFGRNID